MSGEVFVQVTSGSMRVQVETTELATMPPIRLRIVGERGSITSCQLSEADAIHISDALRAVACPERNLVRAILDAEETIDSEHCCHDARQIASGEHGDPLTQIEGLKILAQMIGADRVRALLDELVRP